MSAPIPCAGTSRNEERPAIGLRILLSAAWLTVYVSGAVIWVLAIWSIVMIIGSSDSDHAASDALSSNEYRSGPVSGWRD